MDATRRYGRPQQTHTGLELYNGEAAVNVAKMHLQQCPVFERWHAPRPKGPRRSKVR